MRTRPSSQESTSSMPHAAPMVRRGELPNLRALNFLLEDSLGGGGSASILTDAQGKTHGLALLRLELDVPDEVLAATPEPENPT